MSAEAKPTLDGARRMALTLVACLAELGLKDEAAQAHIIATHLKRRLEGQPVPLLIVSPEPDMQMHGCDPSQIENPKS